AAALRTLSSADVSASTRTSAMSSASNSSTTLAASARTDASSSLRARISSCTACGSWLSISSVTATRRTPASVDARPVAILFNNGSVNSMETSLAQQVGNVDGHRLGGAVHFTGHAVPAFVVAHVGLAGFLVDPEDIQRADVDAD